MPLKPLPRGDLTLHFGDGKVDATVGEGASPPKRVERPRRAPYVAPQQGGLFDESED